MKHNLKISIILLAMFVTTQFIGIYVVDYYSSIKIIDGKSQNVSAPSLPYGMQTPEIRKESDYYSFFSAIIIAFIIAISLLFLLTKFNWDFILKLWFFVVIIIALGIFFNTIIPEFKYTALLILAITVPLAWIKIYGKNIFIHNFTELLIYPGIAAVFVPILNVFTIIILLILISAYDIWAVWHSGIMQKMAKYQIQKLKVFSGFFVPYFSRGVKAKIEKMKKTYTRNQLEEKKIKVNVAILGGGDIIFPIITAGVVLRTFGFFSALFVILGATLGLAYLFFFAEKRKFYPAMPYISAGIFLGMILARVIL